MLSQLNVRLRVHCQVDPSTLTGGFRLHDKCRPLLLPWHRVRLLETQHVTPEFVTITRKKPSLWIEIVLYRKLFLHLIKRFPELIFPRQNKHSWKVVHSLIWSETQQTIRSLSDITPIDIKFLHSWLTALWRQLLILNKSHSILISCDISDYLVLAIRHIDAKLLLSCYSSHPLVLLRRGLLFLYLVHYSNFSFRRLDCFRKMRNRLCLYIWFLIKW